MIDAQEATISSLQGSITDWHETTEYFGSSWCAPITGRETKRPVVFVAFASMESIDPRSRLCRNWAIGEFDDAHPEVWAHFTSSQVTTAISKEERIRRYFETAPADRRAAAPKFASFVESFADVCRIAESGVRGLYRESFSAAIDLLAATGHKLLTIVDKSEHIFTRLPTDNLDIIQSAVARADAVDVRRRIDILVRLVRNRPEPQLLESYLDAIAELGERYSGIRFLASGLIREVLENFTDRMPQIAEAAKDLLEREWVPSGDSVAV